MPNGGRDKRKQHLDPGMSALRQKNFISSVLATEEEHSNGLPKILRFRCDLTAFGHLFQCVYLIHDAVEPLLGGGKTTAVLDVPGYTVEVIISLWLDLSVPSARSRKR